MRTSKDISAGIPRCRMNASAALFDLSTSLGGLATVLVFVDSDGTDIRGHYSIFGGDEPASSVTVRYPVKSLSIVFTCAESGSRKASRGRCQNTAKRPACIGGK